jgi:tripartite-type tricarboxylate transporter receptor subunit TctC
MTKNSMHRRTFLAASAAGMLAPSFGFGQSAWPTGRQIKVTVPFPPAGATDILARILSERFGEYWGARLVVENKPGAGGNLGADQVAKSAPDGDNFLIFSVGMATNPHLFQNTPYDPIKDFDPVSLIAMVPNIMIAGKHTPYNNVKEFLDFAKANPGKVTYGSSGIGTSLHLAGELLQKMTGIKMQHVPYRGAAPAIQDLLAGQIDVVLDNITSALQHARSGAVKGLGITTAKRSQFAPELQPIADVVPGFDVTSWFAFFAPKGTPRAIIDRMQADTKRALAEPAVIAKMATLAADSVGSTPEELGALLKEETERWGKLIKEAGIKAG